MHDLISRQGADLPDTNVGDTIYRQAAIDTLCVSCNMESDYRKCTGYAEDSTWCEEVTALRTLPSAQPEQIQDILDYLDTVLHPIVSPEHWNVYSELYDMISMLSSTQPKQQWIPCSETEPKKSGYYLCTHGGTGIVSTDYYTTKEQAEELFADPEDEYLDLEEYMGWTSKNVIAWMPLPAPYKAESGE